MNLNVHFLHTLKPEFLTALKSKLEPRITLTHGPDVPVPAEYHILVAGLVEKHHLEASPVLHTIIIPWSGLPQATRLLLLECPELAVHNLHHNAVPTAEMALTLMLTAVKSIVLIDRALRNSDWTPRYSPSNASILRDKTALVLGFGAIGREIATMCTGLGMRVTALRRREVCERESAIDIRSIDKLREQLPSARVLFVSMPFTPETEGIIGRDELSLLPDGAVLVNIARGPLVDEAALYAELQSGRLRAGLDVWYNYPKEETDRTKTSPANYPFHELDNVVMTPHLAGHSEDTERLRVEAMAELLNLAVAGEALPNVVDPRRGY